MASFGIRNIFGPGTSVVRLLPEFFLLQPVSLRVLAARKAIADKYQKMNTYKGPLGLTLTDVNQISPGAFMQSFTGGDLHFQDGETSPYPIYQASITYQGVHCFGNPAGLASDSVYLIVNVYDPARPENATTFKIPDDAGGGLIEDFEEGQDNTDGIRQVYGGENAWPAPLIISDMVMGSSLLGDSQKVKEQVADAVKKGADAAGAAPGQLASPGVLDFLAKGFSTIFGGLLDDLGLTDQVRGKPQSIQLRVTPTVNDYLPVQPTKAIGPINFNFETPILTDGDASYKAYFNVQTVRLDKP
jgi:hypothetical protein